MSTSGMALAAALAGLFFGSFGALAGYRLPRGEGVVGGRSRCPRCGTTLGPFELLPVLSWLWLRGRCAGCGGAIAARYPLAELTTAALFGLAVLAFGPTWPALTACALALGLVIVGLADLDRQVIPDAVLIWLLPLALAHRALVSAPWTDTVAGAVVALALGLILRWTAGRWARREALGLGDVKLLAVAGAWVGLGHLPYVLIAAGALGGALAAVWRWRHGGGGFPLGPALAAALYAGVLAPAPW